MQYETAVLAAEADEGITFEESCRALKQNVDVTPPHEMPESEYSIVLTSLYSTT